MKTNSSRPGILLCLAAAFASGSIFTGCQTTIGGQTLPSPNYLEDDVQYYRSGPEFKLHNQVEATKKQAAEKQKLQQGF